MFSLLPKEPGIAGCNAVAVRSSRRQTFTSGGVDMRAHAYSLIIAAKCFYSRVKFSQLVSTTKLY